MVERTRAKPNSKSLIRKAHDDGRHGSRVNAGRDLLPTEDGRSRWARLLKSTLGAIISHCGGKDQMSSVQLMAARRIAALEAELIYSEDRIASIRRKGKEPPASSLQTYAMLANQQLRISKQIGWERFAKQVNPTPDLRSYIASKARGKLNGHHSQVIDHE